MTSEFFLVHSNMVITNVMARLASISASSYVMFFPLSRSVSKSMSKMFPGGRVGFGRRAVARRLAFRVAVVLVSKSF